MRVTSETDRSRKYPRVSHHNGSCWSKETLSILACFSSADQDLSVCEIACNAGVQKQVVILTCENLVAVGWLRMTERATFELRAIADQGASQGLRTTAKSRSRTRETIVTKVYAHRRRHRQCGSDGNPLG
jgi:hypothetical protein